MLQTTISKVAVCVAGGAVAAMTAAGPSLATGPVQATPAKAAAEQSVPQQNAVDRAYWGKVIAHTGLKVRSGPSQKHRVVGILKYGQMVKLRCKVNGQRIQGNPRWYKLYDGSYMWASARFIANVGPAPHWCHR